MRSSGAPIRSAASAIWWPRTPPIETASRWKRPPRLPSALAASQLSWAPRVHALREGGAFFKHALREGS
eukprot:260686-Prymnesium_polylepis.1